MFPTVKMTASREERVYRRSCRKCTRGETVSRLFEDLIKKKIGVRQVEDFVRQERGTFKGEDSYNSKIIKYKEERKIKGE